ncbi:PRC-barrel domain-containing protein [Lusitaniella coriacea LEGE 07157]|uniref:PRC-barrel domain-containing protein n=1 Tax=Lusitaniella coriacea LEGE 07157 TaxID=945747 RepID=A0A8J7IXF9_9CYAN|nr:PRC-barrel domain-containing protein [Lusitaniella coriacea]MBE9118727.1 PRC-barrel domain-containing protein [Lusitaniella coriacea LEGE 07157]
MTTDINRLRSEFINTKVIANNSAKQLGVVKDMLVDIDRREVVALGLRDSLISVAGMPKYMYLASVEKTGDVILVPHEDIIEDVDVDAYSKLIGCEVITENGELLGRVRDFQFNLADGKVSSLIIAAIGLPQIPDQVISTYELGVEEIVSSGPNRIIVFEGCEERLTQVTVGVLERLGIGRPLWEREEDELFANPAANPGNQLGTGIPVRTPVAKPVETRAPVYERPWDEDEWEEPEPIAVSPPPVEKVRYQQYEREYDYQEADYEEDNWGESSSPPRYEQRAYVEPEPPREKYEYDEVKQDVWDDDVKPEPYTPPRINIPEKTKEPEYEDNY